MFSFLLSKTSTTFETQWTLFLSLSLENYNTARRLLPCWDILSHLLEKKKKKKEERRKKKEKRKKEEEEKKKKRDEELKKKIKRLSFKLLYIAYIIQ